MKMRTNVLFEDNNSLGKEATTNPLQYIPNSGEFLWYIENWETKKKRVQNGLETSIYSSPFYTHKNGYKMCLRLEFRGQLSAEDTCLSLYLCIMRGEFDNILQWPFRHEVRLDLLNQETGVPHVSKIVNTLSNTFSKTWNKPITDINNGFCFYEFIKMSELSSNSALCKGNKIIIKATSTTKP